VAVRTFVWVGGCIYVPHPGRAPCSSPLVGRAFMIGRVVTAPTNGAAGSTSSTPGVGWAQGGLRSLAPMCVSLSLSLYLSIYLSISLCVWYGGSVIPATLKYYLSFVSTNHDEDVQEFLLTAAAIGMLFKKGASISAAEVGCQGAGSAPIPSRPAVHRERERERQNDRKTCRQQPLVAHTQPHTCVHAYIHTED
jgi:hypothetical protein